MNQIQTVTLLTLLSTLLITVSYWLSGGWTGVLIGVGLVGVTTLGGWYYSVQIPLGAYNAQPITGSQALSLYRMVSAA